MYNIKYAVLIILFVSFYTSCTNVDSLQEDIVMSKNSKILYEVVCKHPMGYTLRYTVDNETWKNLYYSRNSIWRFKDITGTFMKLSGPCYTDSSMKLIKNKL